MIMSGRKYAGLALLAFLSLLAILNVTDPVSANVPSVLRIDNISQGSSGRIRLQISHLNPSATHYVDMVEVANDATGQITQFNLQPQSSNPFTVEFDLGQLQGTPYIRARAHCTLDGWSTWSNSTPAPEFTEAGAMMVMAFAGSLLMTRKVRRK